MNEFFVPGPIRTDAYQAGFQKAGLLPEGMQDFQLQHLMTRRPLLLQDGRSVATTKLDPGATPKYDQRIISAGILPFVLLELANQRITHADVDESAWFWSDFRFDPRDPSTGAPFPFPEEMFRRVVDEFGGKLPICVLAVPDGQAMYTGEPRVQVFSNVPGCADLTGWIESTLLPYDYTSVEVATRGRMRRERMFEVYRRAHPSLDPDFLWTMTQFMFHDFGRRGSPAAQISGIAHLINFLGTDTSDAAYAARVYLNNRNGFGAGSLVATAHRTMSAWPTIQDAMRAALVGHEDELRSVVADTTGDYLSEMKMLAEFAQNYVGRAGKVIGRPDSGDPMDCVLKGLEIFAKGFPTEVIDNLTSILNAGIIQGDGIDDVIMFAILEAVIDAKYSPLMVAFGMGQENHAALRSHSEDGYKLALVGDGKGGYKPAMKASLSPFKRSIPGAVGLDLSSNSTNRVYPITPEQLLAGDFGDYRVVFDGRPKEYGRFQTQRWTFNETRALAANTWRELAPDPGDTFHPDIRAMQEAYMAQMQAQTTRK